MIGWTSSAMLVGLVGAALPVLIHLLTRPRPVTISFPALALLRDAGRGRQRLSMLRTLLLLALRTGAILGIVLAFAKPYWKEHAELPEPGKAAKVVLVVDQSMSMGATRAGLPLHSQATADAADLLRGLEEGSLAGLVFSGATAHTPLPTLSPNTALLHTKLAEATPTFEHGNPAASLAAAKALVGQGGSIHVFSDFQRTEWADADLALGVPVYLHPCSARDIGNTGVTDIRIHPSNPLPGETVMLHATIQHVAPSDIVTDVSLEIGDVLLRESVTLKPFSSATVTFRFSLPQPGIFAGSVRIPNDALAADDRRHFRMSVLRAMHALVITNATMHGSRPGNFLAWALSPAQEAQQGMTVEKRDPARLDKEALERAAVILIDGSSPIPPECLGPVLAHVAAGIPLLCLLDGPRSLTLMRDFSAIQPQAVTLPFLVESTPAADVITMDPDSAQTPFLRDLALEAGESLRTIRALPLRTTDAAGHGGDIHMRYTDGTVAIATTGYGSGVIAFINCPLSPERGTVAGHPLFPILLHETLSRLRERAAEADFRPGLPGVLYAPQAGHSGEGAWTIRDGEEITDIPIFAEANLIRCEIPPAAKPGVRTIYHGERLVDVVVTNTDPAESLTRQADLELLRLRAGARVRIAATGHDGASAGRPLPLWHICVLAAMGALMLEMLLLLLWPIRRTRAGGMA